MLMGLREITREEIYEAVWSKAVLQVAADFGVSDVWLAKACHRLLVPIPPRGYWAKRASGHFVSQLLLPQRPPGVPNAIEIGKWRRPRTDEEIAEYDGEEPTFSEPIEALRSRVERYLKRIVVHKNLKKPHPLVARLLEEDRAREAQRRASFFAVSPIKLLYDSPDQRRRLLLVSSLFATLEAVGLTPDYGYQEDRNLPLDSFKVTVGETSSWFTVSVTGHARRQSEGRGEKPLRVDARGRVWEDADPSDGDLIRDIAVHLIVAAEEILRAYTIRSHKELLARRAEILDRRQRGIDEQAHREQQAALEAARIEAERLAAEEQAKRDRLFAAAEAHRVAEGVRAYVRQVQARATGEDAGEVEKWAAWALGVADEVDPIVAGRSQESAEPPFGDPAVSPVAD